MPNRLTPLDFNTAVIQSQTMTFTERWETLMRFLFGDVAAISSLPAVVNRFAFAAQPSLGSEDAGYIAFETTYGHMVRWTGSVWEFAPGDVGNRFVRLFVGAPQEIGWQACDGTVSDFLTVGGAALTVSPFTAPNIADGTFLKVLAAYTGAIDPAVAAALTGSTGNGGVAHTHPVTGNTSVEDLGATEVDNHLDGATTLVASDLHVHAVNLTSGAASAFTHTHPAGTLAVDSAARPPSIGLRAYFRR